MSRIGKFVIKLMDKTVEEDNLIQDLRQYFRKSKGKTTKKNELTSYRYNDREKIKHKKLLESDSGPSVLHIAVSCRRNEVAKEMIEWDPSLINCERKDDDYRGQTPFHIAIAMASPDTTDGQDLVETMIDTLSDKLGELMERRVSGKKLRGTVMLGGTPLSIAALDNNEKMVDLLLENGADLNGSDSFGNTVFHSLVLYASFYPNKVDAILSMFDELAKKHSKKPLKYNREVIQRENARNLTALHLAAELGLDEVFRHILDMEDAYKFFSGHDGIFDIYECDITELDKGTWDKAVLQMSPDYRNTEHRAEGLPKGKQDWWIQKYWKNLRQNTSQSILEIICSLDSTTAYALMNNYTVQEVVYRKWKRYSRFYYLFLVLHLALMSVLTWHLDLKVDAIVNPDPAQKQTLTLRVFSSIFIVISLLYILLEFHRSFMSWQPFHLTRLHHNGVYRCIFVLFGLALLIDASWNVVTVTNNYSLIIALVLGWWSTTFFLRGIGPWSHITLMLQKVLFGDMLKFMPIIFIMLLAFTSAMHSSMAITQPDAFGNFRFSLITMFRLMTGQGEVDGLEGEGSVTVFVLSVIVIQIFLLNILIAIMSTTCESVENSNKLLWLQRLSIVIFIEGILPKRLKPPMGREDKTDYGSTRYRLEIDRLRDEDSSQSFEQTGNLSISLLGLLNRSKVEETTKPTTLLRNFLNQPTGEPTRTLPDHRASDVQYLEIHNYGQ